MKFSDNSWAYLKFFRRHWDYYWPETLQPNDFKDFSNYV